MKRAKSIYETLKWHKEAGYEFSMWDCSDPNNYFLVLQEPTRDNLFPTTAFIGFHKSAFKTVRNWVRELWQEKEYII